MSDSIPFVFAAISLVHAAVFGALWLSVGLIGFVRIPRHHPRPRMVLLLAGLTGLTVSIVWPIVNTLVSALLIRTGGVDTMLQIQAGMAFVNTIIWLVPWCLLLYGLVETIRVVTPSDDP